GTSCRRQVQRKNGRRSARLTCCGIGSGLRLDLSGPPGLVEPRFKWTVQPQDRVPTLTGNSLDPVNLLTGRRFRSKVHIDRSVRIHQQALGLAADAGEALIGLDHRARLIAVE